ncbi:hypothetical protein [Novipirellula artificiosorum]|uniref:Uncharacterized protein n=1 Tax=Novipirellula artificiosorum TaxID=2528016 RepID=A0A5C6D8P0_9BACT|nr:hypothetical protein [Novipirellula artificiosorum]TWU33210.1 hypothetical protein Poly41_49620 [Novipirellula artificiosorum]
MRPDAKRRKTIRERYRAATAIHAMIASPQNRPDRVSIDPQLLTRITSLEQRKQTAERLHWQSASLQLDQQLIQSVRALVNQATLKIDRLESEPNLPQVCSVREILDDLTGLEADFGVVNIDRKNATVSVVTDEIVLDGVSLGPFEIQLQWRYLGNSNCYSVIARDPNPASICESNTHPHVQDDRLCEGEGHSAIKRALSEGRVHDFFVIVRQILHNYNPASAYVTLDDWEGVECRDCGSTINKDGASECSDCHCDLCNECSTSCDDCGEPLCDDCRRPCKSCDNDYCRCCLTRCSGCGESVCQGCLNKGERCDDCLEKKEQEEAGVESSTPVTDEDTVLSLCVGETIVSS